MILARTSFGGKSGYVAAVAGAAVVFGAAAFAWNGAGASYDPEGFVQDGEAGFVISSFAYVLGPDQADPSTCPDGLSKNVDEIFQSMPGGGQRLGESDEDYGERVREGGASLTRTPTGQDYCQHPDLAPKAVHYRTVQGTSVKVDGLDLDGKNTPSSDFISPSGTNGVDNEFFRAVGCNSSYRPGGQSNNFEINMLAGEWGLVIRLTGIDDVVNDDDVDVGIFANGDPISLSPAREAIEYATYALDQRDRFRAFTKGRIRDGILSTDPVDVRVPYVVNSMYLERPLRDARIEATLGEDGTLSGVMGGFTSVEAMFNYQFGYRDAKNAAGEPADENLRNRSANGAARALGHTCGGVYQALNRLADGHPDPETNRKTSISTQYRFKAVPAFLVDVESGGRNDELVDGKGV